jgi:hypothetical protein
MHFCVTAMVLFLNAYSAGLETAYNYFALLLGWRGFVGQQDGGGWLQ